jgi:hypothetical protein
MPTVFLDVLGDRKGETNKPDVGNAAADILLPLIDMASVTVVLLPVLVAGLVLAGVHEASLITGAAQAAAGGAPATVTLQPLTESLTIVCQSRSVLHSLQTHYSVLVSKLLCMS